MFKDLKYNVLYLANLFIIYMIKITLPKRLTRFLASTFSIYKLQYYGVRGDTLRWIMSFPANRKQLELLKGEKSSEADVISSVPQGTVLGPIFFLEYIYDLPDCITSSETHLFANDSLLFALSSLIRMHTSNRRILRLLRSEEVANEVLPGKMYSAAHQY